MGFLASSRSRHRLRRNEWWLLTLSLLALVLLLSPPERLQRINHLVQDAALRLHQRSPQPEIALIAIDEASLAAIGRWPWRRALHAQLLNTVAQQQPRAIALDILFSEPDLDYPGDDLLLAHALSATGRTVLPVVQRSHGATDGTHSAQTDLPLALLANAAAALGHVHVALGNDGVVRHLFLQEGPHSAPWPHLSVALQCAAGAALPECRAPSTASTSTLPEPWVQQQHQRIAYTGAVAQWPSYSYIDVLRGQVPANAFTDKYVLVGAVALGLGDVFATPVNPSARLMPGVHIVAHTLDAQLAGIQWQAAPGWINTAFNAVPIAAALLGLWLLGPLAGLALIAALLLGTTALALAAPWLWGVPLAPAAALLVLALVYPLWSWRRLHAATHYLQRQMQRLQQENLPLLAPLPARGDFLQRRMDAVEQATQQLRALHRFVSESLEQLPSPIFVCSAAGEVVLANAAARAYAASTSTNLHTPKATLQGRCVAEVLAQLRCSGDQQPLLSAQALQAGRVPAHSEGQDAQGRSLLLQCQSFAASDKEAGQAGWLLTLVDLSDIRRALALRDEALNFISHDIRAPNASILTLLAMQRANPEQLAAPELLARIERYAHSSLGMAEGFVQLASAQSQPLAHETLDLVSVLEETIDDAWVLARQQRVTVRTLSAPNTPAPEVALCQGDRTLLHRALANVVSNALKYSPPDAQVLCRIQARAGHWVISVRDQGPGIPGEQMQRLCTPFARLHTRSHPGISGIGLGLALVQTVLQRHGGTLEIESTPGEGAQFSLVLPQAQEALD